MVKLFHRPDGSVHKNPELNLKIVYLDIVESAPVGI